MAMASTQKQLDEIKSQLALAFAEAAAAQLVLVNLMRNLRGVIPSEVLEKAFDETADDLIATSMRLGSPNTPTHAPETLRIVEDLRKIVFTRKNTPKGTV
jgi:hypothetical protein